MTQSKLLFTVIKWTAEKTIFLFFISAFAKKTRRKVFQFSHENKFNFTCGMNVNLPFGTFNASSAHILLGYKVGPKHISLEKRMRGTKAPKWYDNLNFIVQLFIPDFPRNFRFQSIKWETKFNFLCRNFFSLLTLNFYVFIFIVSIWRIIQDEEHSRTIIFLLLWDS